MNFINTDTKDLNEMIESWGIISNDKAKKDINKRLDDLYGDLRLAREEVDSIEESITMLEDELLSIKRNTFNHIIPKSSQIDDEDVELATEAMRQLKIRNEFLSKQLVMTL